MECRATPCPAQPRKAMLSLASPCCFPFGMPAHKFDLVCRCFLAVPRLALPRHAPPRLAQPCHAIISPYGEMPDEWFDPPTRILIPHPHPLRADRHTRTADRQDSHQPGYTPCHHHTGGTRVSSPLFAYTHIHTQDT